MSTCQDIVRRALRLLAVVPAGQEPTGTDAEDGRDALQSLILGIPGLILNGRFHERAVSTAYTAKEGERLTATGAAAITLPLTVTWDGCTRPPHDLAKVQIVGKVDNAGLWLWSATKEAWGRADGLTLESELPFGTEDDRGLGAQLAADLMDEYSATLGQRTLALAQQSARSLRARLKKYDDLHSRHHHDEPGLCDYPWA